MHNHSLLRMSLVPGKLECEIKPVNQYMFLEVCIRSALYRVVWTARKEVIKCFFCPSEVDNLFEKTEMTPGTKQNN